MRQLGVESGGKAAGRPKTLTLTNEGSVEERWVAEARRAKKAPGHVKQKEVRAHLARFADFGVDIAGC